MATKSGGGINKVIDIGHLYRANEKFDNNLLIFNYISYVKDKFKQSAL